MVICRKYYYKFATYANFTFYIYMSTMKCYKLLTYSKS